MALIDIKADEENYCLFTKDLEAKYQILRTRPEFQDSTALTFTTDCSRLTNLNCR